MITVSEDIRECPSCGAPAINTTRTHRHCNTCGLAWEFVSAEHELDAEADRLVRGREYNEERGRGKTIARYQTRW